MKTDEKCTQIMDSFLKLDKDERIPLKTTMHLLSCRNCRTQVRLMTKAERLAEAPLHFTAPVSNESLWNTIKNLNPSWKLELKPVSFAKWLWGGILMILFLILFAVFIRGTQNESYLIAFYLVFAGCICLYTAVFVGSNMDFFVKKFTNL